MFKQERITLFAGHYGSGKTNLAVNYAVLLKKSRDKVALVGMDVVNPYFRSKDSSRLLSEKGILFISSELEEVVRDCQRVVVLRERNKVGELSGGDINLTAVLRMIAG
jgi:energy-coupling factor transporter ATP-binding protein EcfA2